MFGIILNVVAIFGCLVASRLDTNLGSKTVVMAALVMLTIATLGIVSTGPGYTLFGALMLPAADSGGLFGTPAEKAYIVFGLLIGLAFGPVQASSRSYLARSVTPDEAGRYFGIYALAGRATSFAAPFLVATVTAMSGSPRLGMATILTGVEYAFTSQAVVFQGVPSQYVEIGAGEWLGLSHQIWIALVVAVVLWVMLDATEPGRFMYAIGGNPEAARLSGIRTRTLRIVGFVIVALAATVVGILISSAGGGYTPNPGQYLLLPAYAGAFLGAACFRPGEFNIPGTVVGVLFLGTIATGLTLLNLQTYLINLVQGAILVVAVLFRTVATRRA